MKLVFYLSTFSTPYMSHFLYLMFRCDFDVMENLESLEEFGGSEHSPSVRAYVRNEAIDLDVFLSFSRNGSG